MTILRSILLPAALACLVLSSPLLESRAKACGGPVASSPAAEVQWAVQEAMGGEPATRRLLIRRYRQWLFELARDQGARGMICGRSGLLQEDAEPMPRVDAHWTGVGAPVVPNHVARAIFPAPTTR